jgi:hypothetical protein
MDGKLQEKVLEKLRDEIASFYQIPKIILFGECKTPRYHDKGMYTRIAAKIMYFESMKKYMERVRIINTIGYFDSSINYNQLIMFTTKELRKMYKGLLR